MTDVTPTTVIQHCSAFGEWTTVRRSPPPHLRRHVRSYEGYVETRADFATRMQTPGLDAVIIINLGPPYRITGPGNVSGGGEYGSFVSGMVDAHVLVEATGLAAGIQVNLTPIGAGLVFGAPMSEFTNRAFALADVLGPGAARLEARLDDTPDWDDRFHILDRFIEQRIAAAPIPPPQVELALARIIASRGAASVQSLADAAGYSRKHLAARFHEYVGLPPKTMARIVRFDLMQRRLRDGWDGRWADLAVAAGYYDQAHFNRDFRDFTGATPGEFRRRLLPAGGGILG